MNQAYLRRFVFISILVLSAVSFAQQPALGAETPTDTITASSLVNSAITHTAPPFFRLRRGGSMAGNPYSYDGTSRWRPRAVILVKYDTATGRNPREGPESPPRSSRLKAAKESLQIGDLVGPRTTNASDVLRILAVYGAHILAETTGFPDRYNRQLRSWRRCAQGPRV